MNLTIELEQENDGRWIAEIPELPGVMVYGTTTAEAQTKAAALALRVIADRLENDSPREQPLQISVRVA